jgi:hypothetical protein
VTPNSTSGLYCLVVLVSVCENVHCVVPATDGRRTQRSHADQMYSFCVQVERLHW